MTDKTKTSPKGEATPRALTTSDLFWAKVDRRGPDECWLWLGWEDNKGYGCLNHGRRGLRANRVAYELLIGPIPPGLVLDHYRLNPGPRQAPCSTLCVNPAHVEPVTQRENLLRGRTITARNASVTHCPAGHPYDVPNTRQRPRGGRQCRACDRAWKRKKYRPVLSEVSQ